jgi:hypothetical protein
MVSYSRSRVAACVQPCFSPLGVECPRCESGERWSVTQRSNTRPRARAPMMEKNPSPPRLRTAGKGPSTGAARLSQGARCCTVHRRAPRRVPTGLGRVRRLGDQSSSCRRSRVIEIGEHVAGHPLLGVGALGLPMPKRSRMKPSAPRLDTVLFSPLCPRCPRPPSAAAGRRQIQLVVDDEDVLHRHLVEARRLASERPDRFMYVWGSRKRSARPPGRPGPPALELVLVERGRGPRAAAPPRPWKPML